MALSPQAFQRQIPLQEQIYQALRTAILTGELRPGQRLLETQLASQLQVSRTPIREAISLLRHDHLAVVDRQGAVRVAQLSVKQAAELYDCRHALETLAAQSACTQATTAQIEELEYLVHQAEKWSDRHNNSQLADYTLLDLDYRFHRLLAQASGNTALSGLLDQVFDQMLLLRIQTLQQNPHVLEVRVEHRLIYEAVAQRDPIQALTAIQDHLTTSKARVIWEVEQINAEQINTKQIHAGTKSHE